MLSVELGLTNKIKSFALPGLSWLMLAALGSSTSVLARDSISVVGSSTVYPFSKVVAERFGRSTRYKTPTIEQIGTGGGFKEFCRKIGVDSVDIANASRRIKDSEYRFCVSNGVTSIVEVQIGYDGIVLANDVNSKSFEISRKEIYLALAKYVPDPRGNAVAVDNPYRLWSEINPNLPELAIEVIGPSSSSGTRDTFVELVMNVGCSQFKWLQSLKERNFGRYWQVCNLIREDGAYIEAGENDHFILQKLNKRPSALGIFGFSFLDQNVDKVQAAVIDGVSPSFETIASREYPVTRALYFYVKKAHINVVPGIKAFLREFTSEKAWGDDGYLSDKGMIPSSPEERAAIKAKVVALEELDEL